MTLRYIILGADYESYEEDFFNKFMDNVRFVSNYITRKIRSCKVETDGTFNMISVYITKASDSCSLKAENVLAVKVHVSENSMINYLKMKDENTRFEYYLSILEKGYSIALNHKNIPQKLLLTIHQEFRQGGYLNEHLFKSMQLKELGIGIKLFHSLSSYDYKLKLIVFNNKKELLGKGVVYQTFPDEILFDKNVKHVVINNENLVVTDFLNKPQFVCNLSDLSNGIIKSKCVDDNTRKYIYNEQNAEKFERLKW